MPYDLSAFDAPQRDPGEAVRARLAQALHESRRESRTQTVDGKTFDQAIAEMRDTAQHIKNAGSGFGLRINQPAFDAWSENGPMSQNIEDRRTKNTVTGKTEQRTRLNKQLRFADDLQGFNDPPKDAGGSYFPALAAMSGMQQAPPLAQFEGGDHLRQGMPPQQVRGPIQTIKDAFTPRQDEQGNPKADSLGSILNAALMSMGRTPGSARVSNPVVPMKPYKPNTTFTGEPELPSRQLHEPERIVGASVVLDGKVFVAPNHALALMKAEKLGVDPAPAYQQANKNNWWPGDANTEGGFVTSHGRLVSRHEAVDVMEKAGSLKFDPGLEAVRAEMKRKGIWAEDVSGPLKAKHNEHLVNEWNGRPVKDFSQSSHPLVDGATEPLKRDVIERGRSGRPNRTEPLGIGNEEEMRAAEADEASNP